MICFGVNLLLKDFYKYQAFCFTSLLSWIPLDSSKHVSFHSSSSQNHSASGLCQGSTKYDIRMTDMIMIKSQPDFKFPYCLYKKKCPLQKLLITIILYHIQTVMYNLITFTSSVSKDSDLVTACIFQLKIKILISTDLLSLWHTLAQHSLFLAVWTQMHQGIGHI